ncbi:hypothetical protein [Fischerella thermalis]|uniref:hypothetical protein n=1 Tax=Fischerella thermalis TaxID=372787 RepID=UPI00242F94B4|nr:hypothetical protein [Fischerella thermalis]
MAVEDHQDRLRLRWTHAGKRYCLALGLPNSKVNLKAAKHNPVLENADYSIAIPTEHQSSARSHGCLLSKSNRRMESDC